MSKFGAALTRAVSSLGVALCLSILGLPVQVTPVSADTIPFWEEQPSLTGKAPRAAKRVRAAAATEDGEARPAKRKPKRYASRGPMEDYDIRPRRSLSGGVSWNAPSGCLNSTLRTVIADIASSYGSVRVNSTCRSRGHNARVGGARRSHHLTGDAVDFRVSGNVRGTLAYLRNHGSIGGVKHYGGGLIHADTGPRRSW